MKYGALAALTPLVALALGAAGCKLEVSQNNHASQQVLYSSTLSDPRTFNPVLVTDSGSAEVVDNVFEGLVRINPQTTLPEPNLAERWELGDGGRTITFHLRRGLKWSDGEPLRASDVVFTMRVIYDPGVPNSMRPILTVDGEPIKTEALDDYTVRMTMPRPFAPILYSVGFQIIPEHVLKPAFTASGFNRTWGIDTAPAQIVGAGPYRLTQYVPAQVLRFERNGHYWMRDEKDGPLPKLKGQVTLIVQDQNAAYLRFLSGQTDLYNPRPEEVVDLREKATKLKCKLAEVGVDTGSLFFTFNRNPRHYLRQGKADPKLSWFNDINFLRAIAHDMDKQAMINLCFHGLAVPALGDISPANKLFYNPNLKDYDYNPKLAAEILEAAGYHLIAPRRRVDRQGNPLEFNLTTNTGVAQRDQMCAIFQQDLAELGIKVNYRPVEFTTLVEKLDSTFDWDSVLIGFTGTIEPNNGANFLRSSGNLHIWNPGQKKPATAWEAEIDRLLDEGTKEMDAHRRAPYYWRIQEILHDQLAVIETVRQLRYAAYRASLANLVPTVWGFYRPEYIEFRQE